MSTAALASAHEALSGPHGDDRLRTLFAPIRDMTSTMAMVVAGSVVLHVLVVATAVVGVRTPLPPPSEIAVEVVQEVPKPTKPLAAKPPEPARSVPKPAPAPRPINADTALQKELAALRAEQAALRSQLAASAATPSDKTQEASGKAQALDSSTRDAGDPVGYQQLVFSQLAKAKDRAGFHGVIGTTGERFEIAANGTLAGVVVAVPSGDADLDREAVAIVNRAAPFPPPPKAADRIVFANVNFVPRR